MKNRLHNQMGITLVELLATIVIISIISTIIFGVLMNAQNTYKRQANKNQEITDLAYQLKVFTKNIRMATDVTSNDQCNTTLSIGGTEYQINTDTITYKTSGSVYLDHVETLSCTMNSTDPTLINSIDITLKTDKTEASTKIIVRRDS